MKNLSVIFQRSHQIMNSAITTALDRPLLQFIDGELALNSLLEQLQILIQFIELALKLWFLL